MEEVIGLLREPKMDTFCLYDTEINKRIAWVAFYDVKHISHSLVFIHESMVLLWLISSVVMILKRCRAEFQLCIPSSVTAERPQLQRWNNL